MPPYDLFLLANHNGFQVQSFGKVSKDFHDSCDSIGFIMITLQCGSNLGLLGALFIKSDCVRLDIHGSQIKTNIACMQTQLIP